MSEPQQKCCDSDLLGRGRCDTCPYTKDCTKKTTNQIDEVLKKERKTDTRDKGDSL